MKDTDHFALLLNCPYWAYIGAINTVEKRISYCNHKQLHQNCQLYTHIVYVHKDIGFSVRGAVLYL